MFTARRRSRPWAATMAALALSGAFVLMGAGVSAAWGDEPDPADGVVDVTAPQDAPALPDDTSATPAPDTSETPAEPTDDPSQATQPDDGRAPGESPEPSPGETENATQPQTVPEGDDLAVTAVATSVAKGSAGKDIRVDVRNLKDEGEGPARRPRLTVDISALSTGVEVVAFGEGCSHEGTEISCQLPDLEMGAVVTVVALTVRPTADAAPGPAGSYTATVHSSYMDYRPENNTDTATLTITESDVDLVVTTQNVGRLDPGQAGELRYRVANHGDATADELWATITLPAYVRFADRLDHCAYDDPKRTARCRLDDPLAPGEETSQLVPVAVTTNAPHRWILGEGSVQVGTSKTYNDAGDDIAGFAVWSGDNTSDLAVTVTPVKGQIGEKVTATVTVKNNGPGDIAVDVRGEVTAPEGTTVLSDEYPQFGSLAAGKSVTWRVTLRIDAAPGEPGLVKVYAEGYYVPIPPDPDSSNDTAPIVVELGSGDGGGGGSDDSAGGSLPITGMPGGLLGVTGAGLAAVVLGGALYLMARRRTKEQAVAHPELSEQPVG